MGVSKKYTHKFFNPLAESVILMALDNPDSLGDQVASCGRKKELLMNTKILKCMIVIIGAIYILWE